MINEEEEYEVLRAQGEAHLIPVGSSPASPPTAGVPRRRMGFGQRVVVTILLSVVLIPPAAGFYSYFSGVPLHLLAAVKENKADTTAASSPGVSLVPGKAHSVSVPAEVCTALGIQKGQHDLIALAQPPSMMRPLVLPGSTAIDPTRLARIRARFAPARVVELGQAWDFSRNSGHTEFRELRPGDTVSKGQVLGIFFSVDVGSKKNDLLDALVQLELDQKIMDRVEANKYAIPEVMYLTQVRAVQGDRNAISRALNNLKLWDIPQDEIDALQAEAKKIGGDQNSWSRTPEGRWVKGEKQANTGNADTDKDKESPWGRVTLRAPFDGIIIERNVHKDEMVVDNTVNLFQIADVNRLLVIANCQEDALPTLEALQGVQRRWTVRTVGAESATGLSGTIDEIGYLIDPNQHTAVIKGYVENPGQRIRAGQYVTATVNIPPPPDVVEIPADALVDDGKQSLVFVQPEASSHLFTMRRVQVTHRFERSVFVRNTPIPKEEQLTAREAEEGLLPKEPLRPGERVLLAGAVELKAALLDLESEPAKTKDAEKE
ncbi:MAG TPA: efflux RND transporter periplasmic adaptor subunit [Isosphaeraceae bacterium]|nr:efflux RND transporter periplasmic adaptor subunit [Isosphaeraceae bacterium]